jgi:hypothetical protein
MNINVNDHHKRTKHVIKHELLLSIVTIPATIGANVLNIGKNLAKMMAHLRAFQKNL